MIEANFWSAVDELINNSTIVIDRPKDSAHPRYPHCIYPVDYGYLSNTASMDGSGIDVWDGSSGDCCANAIICTVDLLKRDSEIKLLIGCTDAEKQHILEFHNDSEYMKGILIERKVLFKCPGYSFPSQLHFCGAPQNSFTKKVPVLTKSTPT